MKLTKARLKRIIKEEVKVLDPYGNPLKPLRDWEFELKDGSYNEKFKHAEGWALARAHYKGLVPDGVDTSDDNIKTVKNPMRSGAKRTSESKLTKAKLKRIIKEEIEGMMKEVGQEPVEVEVDDKETPEEKERRLRADDLKAAKEILKRRIGGYSGTALPGGKRIK